ncbi:MAG: ABC transporter permease [bacterium]|nr:ABC transporter permease [bacterium]
MAEDLAPVTPAQGGFTRFFANLGEYFLSGMYYIGGLTFLSGQLFLSLLRDPFPLGETTKQFEEVGIKSASLTNLIALFTGLVIAVQFIVGLSRFGLQLYTGQIVGIAIARELAPVLTALMVAARVGAGITAEIGSMNVTEQVSAIEAMGANPINKLVVPRVIATTFCAPILTVIANFVGILGSMFITTLETGIGSMYFIDQVTSTVKMIDFGSGIAKTFFFGFFIGIISCYQGLNTRGGTEGVGRSTTLSVVYSSICIFISDFFLTKLFLTF